MVISDAAADAAPLEQKIEANRLEPRVVAAAATELAGLLSSVDQSQLNADASVRLSILLGSLDDLVRDMKAASADIQRLLATA